MRNKISAIIIDPEYYKHNYLDIKCFENDEHAEKRFELKILDNDKNILKEFFKFNHFDAIITIGDISNYKELTKLPFEYRSKWCHHETFNGKEIANNILSILSYNLTRNDKPKKFSFFTCTYNTGEYRLNRLYKSLKSQTYNEWNWFIIDDSPNDKTIELIESLQDPRITVIKNVTRHGNIGFNKHTIAMMCDGDYLVEVDHDDELTNDCLYHLYNAFNEYNDADFAYSLCVEYSVSNKGKEPIIYGEGWGWGEGKHKRELVKDKYVYFSESPNINPYTIRTIYCQPNHVRCWKRDFYHKIGGHNTELSVLDDMDLLIRTFLNTKMIKVDKVLYLQYQDAGVRGSDECNNTQSKRYSEIQRTVWILKNHYDLAIHERINELGFNDEPWDEKLKQSILWKNHTPDQENMNYIYKP